MCGPTHMGVEFQKSGLSLEYFVPEAVEETNQSIKEEIEGSLMWCSVSVGVEG